MSVEHSPEKSFALSINFDPKGPQTNNTTNLYSIFGQQTPSSTQKPERSRRDIASDLDQTASDKDFEMGDRFDDLMKAIQGVSADVKKSNADQIGKLEELRHDVNTQMNSLNSKVMKVEELTEKTVEDVAGLQVRMNDLEQSKLATHMNVAGIANNIISSRMKDAPALAREVMRSFGINVLPDDISHSYIRQQTVTKTFLLVIIFKDIETKIAAMKKKRESAENRGIFFEHSMTPTVRSLFMNARKIAKVSEDLKTSLLKSGRVFIMKNDGNLLAVKTHDDIARIGSQFTKRRQPVQ